LILWCVARGSGWAAPALVAWIVGCGAGDRPAWNDVPADGGADVASEVAEAPLALVAVTFNTGTSGEVIAGRAIPEGGYGPAQAAISDAWYGNGLAWPPLVDDTAAFLAEVDPDLVVFQEIFWSGACPEIPDDNRTGFVCEGWSPGDPTVAQTLVGAGFQVACHVGKPDKCAAVNRRLGVFRGCDADLCLEGLFGTTVSGCGRGARVARVVIELAAGGALTLVNVHGSSGFDPPDKACRVRQVDQVFVDLGDGAPAASGHRNLVMGDLNTDPGRLADFDPSAARWLDFVGEDRGFHWVSPIGSEVPPTYAGVANIDHVVSDTLRGDCWAPTVTAGHGAFTDIAFFDHLPLVCTLSE